MSNYFEMKLKAISENEKFARNAVAAFAVSLNPSIGEIDDIKTAVSEAVTNCIVHGYNYADNKDIYISVAVEGKRLTVTVRDEGVGIADIELALTPFYTTREADDRSGMGFTLMQSFTDNLTVESSVGKGTTVTMVKEFDKDAEVEV